MKNKYIIATATLIITVFAGALVTGHPTALPSNSKSSTSDEPNLAPNVSLSAPPSHSAAQRLRQFGNRMGAAFAKYSPLGGGDDAQFNTGLANLRNAVSQAKARPSTDLERDLKLLNTRIEAEGWIERANSGALTKDEEEILRNIIDDQAALNLALIQRKLADVEREFL